MDFSFDPQIGPGAPWRPGLVGGLFADRGLCGRSMNGGLLRFHDAASAPTAQETVDAMFGTRGLDAEVFAFDWLARQFAVTPQLTVEGTPAPGERLSTVVVLDPFDGSVTPWVDLPSFEGALRVPLAQDFLLPGLFREWTNAVGTGQLPFDSCAGTSVPAFYGGRRELGNLTLDPAEVYLSFTQQLWERKRHERTDSPPPHLRIARRS